jgi:hypothetical protein
MSFAVRSKLEHPHSARTLAHLPLLGILGEQRRGRSEYQPADDGQHGFAV